MFGNLFENKKGLIWDLNKFQHEIMNVSDPSNLFDKGLTIKKSVE